MKMSKTMLVYCLLCFLPVTLFSQTVTITGDSPINRCDLGTYNISIENTSGESMTNLVVTAKLDDLTGFSYVDLTTNIQKTGGNICSADPVTSGGYSGSCAPAPASPYLTWDIDALCGGPFTLNDNETLVISFNLETDCQAVSGSLNSLVDYKIGGTPDCDNTGYLTIQVNPGAVSIKKTLNVIPQEIGGNVTWTITVENTGFGWIKNVVVTDVLGDGLEYVFSTQNGSNFGQTTTWGPNEIAALDLMNPGDFITMDITAKVIAAQNLENTADVRFGCDMVADCWNTTIDGGTANASVQRIVKTPLLSYTPPDINFDYCGNDESVSFVISNIGDDTANDIWIIVDFVNLAVSNVSAGATYNSSDKRFELNDPIAPAGAYTLSFDLSATDWCNFPAGALIWQCQYKDGADNYFYPPVELSTIYEPAGATSLTVQVNNTPEIVQIAAQFNYNITSSYTGSTNCGGSTGNVTVVNTVPDGFTVINIGGGVWTPGGGGTGGTITWTYLPPSTLNINVTLQAPHLSDCEAYCKTEFENKVSAYVTDCCGCPLSATSSEYSAIECEQGVDSEKTASAGPHLRCNSIQYTNTYIFEGGSAVNLDDLTFTDHADNEQSYQPASLSINLTGSGDVTGNVAINDNTAAVGGMLGLDFSGCAATPLAGQTLTIVYTLTTTKETVPACGDTRIISWSSLNLGFAGSDCVGDGTIHESAVVEVQAPAMSVDISGLGLIFHNCESKTITITLTQNSTIADPKDVKLVLSGLNYYGINPAATTGTGILPVSGNFIPNIVGDDYVWEFGDGFTGSGQNAKITFEIQKRCTGSKDLVATAYYDDNCKDDATYDKICSTKTTETPALYLNGDLIIEQTPEVYYADGNIVQWEIYLTNRGTGTAYNVWIDDVLGSGLIYEHGVNPAVVSGDNTGVTINDSQDHLGNAINGVSIEIPLMTAGERRQITMYAKMVNCNNLTNDVSASWGCISVDCMTEVTDNSIVELPAPKLINSTSVTSPVDACTSPKDYITLKNAGQTICYNLQVTETLPDDLTYIPGSTSWRLNGGGWNGPNAAYNPNPTPSSLVWTSTVIPALATLTPGDIIEIEFDLTTDCPFSGGEVTLDTQYENPCGQVFNTAQSRFTAGFRAPEVKVNVTRPDEPIGCGKLVEWTITVQNNSGYTLPIIWIEDVLSNAYTLGTISSTGDATYTGDTGTVNGRKVTWEITNLPNGATATVTVTANVDSPPCSNDLDNTITAWWGCGAADGLSTTKPGEPGDDSDCCLSAASVSDTNTPTREPTISFQPITMNPASIGSCNQNTEVTVVFENNGLTDAYNLDLVVTLPDGLSYNTGSSGSCSGGDNSCVPGGIGDPAVAGQTITFGDINDKGSYLISTLQKNSETDTGVLKFSVTAQCFQTSNLEFELYYYDCCDDTRHSIDATKTLTGLSPDLSITQTPLNSQVDCGATQTWTITVTNNGTGAADVVRIEDTPGDWIDVRTGSPGDPTDMGNNVYGWEINDIAGSGGTANFTLVGTLNPDGLPNQLDCTTALRQNNVKAIWGCGNCTHDTWAETQAATLKMPDLKIISITPNISCTGDGSFNTSLVVRVKNEGDGDSNADFTVQLQDGKGWTGTGTHSGTIASGSFVNVTIDTQTWNQACGSCNPTYIFNATVDLNNDVCECNETNNLFDPQDYNLPIVDLEVTDINFSNLTCQNDVLQGYVEVEIKNSGCIAANNFKVSLINDGCLTVRSPASVTSLDPNTSKTVQFNMTGNYSDCSDCSCEFTAFVDSESELCECSGTNNTLIKTYTHLLPDLAVNSVNATIPENSNQGTVVVNVSNDGCTNVANAVVRVTCNNCPITFTDQTVNINKGANTNVTFNFTSSCPGCNYCFTATIDPDNSVCECSSLNNFGMDCLHADNYDFGDAPDPLDQTAGLYPTFYVNNGAAHFVTNNIYLGSGIDVDLEGQPTAGATGDDADADGDDEDGVDVSKLSFVEGKTPAVNVAVVNNTGNEATIKGWIDYNGDGVFHQSESATTTTSSSGIVTLNFPLVSAKPATSTFARFRISTLAAAVNLPTGLASDGEVEDYTVSIRKDTDGDGVPDDVEGTTDRDNDNIPNNEDYDPTGYFYDEANAKIIADGKIEVTGPGVITIVKDGSDGYYQFLTDGTAGIYTMAVTLPIGVAWSSTCSVTAGALDPTGKPHPYVLGNGENGNTGYLTSNACTQFYLQFDLEPGDPFIFNNNFPLKLQQPIGITLNSFDVQVGQDGILTYWVTGTEANCAGFNIFRSQIENENYAKLNESLIPALGDATSGANYSYLDKPEQAGNYYYKLQAVSLDGAIVFYDPVFVALTSVEIKRYEIPENYSLSQNYPNPFNPETTIEFGLPKPGFVEISIYDINGKLVRTLVSENKRAGNHWIKWDARDESGIGVSSGVYFYLMKVEDTIGGAGFSQTNKMILMK
jgi:uncharacterized repeat protein (TIGR01451 family)